VLLRKATRPTSCQHIFEGLRLSNSRKWIAHGAFDEFENANRDFPIVFDPVTKILPEAGMKYRLPLNLPLSAARQGPSPGGTLPAVLVCPFWLALVVARPKVAAHS
jgi:hypothetical protein